MISGKNNEEKFNRENWPKNEIIIKKILDGYRHSKQSQGTRKSALNYFFQEKYFGYKGHIFEITRRDLKDYLDYLNHLTHNPKGQTLSITTKRTKYTILKSFLEECEDYYGDEEEYNFSYSFPKKIKWTRDFEPPKSNKNVFMSIETIKKILDHLKYTHFPYYLIFRIMAESGPRKGGIINLDYDNVFLNERYFKTREKNGINIYYLSEDIMKYLKVYLDERKKIKGSTKALFLSTQMKRHCRRTFNKFLKIILYELEIKENVTCHTFRKSLNNLREKMGCPPEKRKILLNHAVEGVNFNNYVEKDLKKFRDYFDTWNPYTVAKIQL